MCQRCTRGARPSAGVIGRRRFSASGTGRKCAAEGLSGMSAGTTGSLGARAGADRHGRQHSKHPFETGRLRGYRDSTSSRMPVLSSPSIEMSMNEGMQTRSMPPGAT